MRAVVCALVCVALVGCDQAKKIAGQTPDEKLSSQKTWKREEFRAMLMGKTQEQVLQAVGRPKHTSEVSNTASYWYYYQVTVDPVTGNTDARVQVVFTPAGVVRAINF